MVEAEATQDNDAPESAPAASISDWSEIRGFQVDTSTSPESARDPDVYRVELAKEMTSRAARFAQSVDDAIVLSSDGLFRWLGDPVARLVGGDDILQPRAVLLADDALSGEARESVETRLALWIKAHIQKVLGPLTALADEAQVVEPARDLAQRIVQALGVLERDRVRQQVKNLDQGARSALRKLGVRFGAAYIFVPALLKPGARALCSQLWSLRRGTEPGAERLLAFAAAGRTSFAAEAPLGPETYRVAGFRLCGDRVVRVDIVERLTDLIRAAIPDYMRPGTRPPSEAHGFLVTPQMTSLTGCAGESFASILRSLGFESLKVKKSEYEAANRKAPTEPIKPAVSEEAGPQAETASSEEAGEAVSEAEPLQGEVAATPAAAEHETAPEPVELADASVVEPEPAPVEANLSEAEAVNPATETAASESTSETAEPAANEAEASLETASPAEDEEIEIWRPAPRKPAQPHRRPHAAGETDAPRGPRHGREHHGRRGGEPAAPAVAAEWGE